MEHQFEPRIGAWYTGECDTGAFLIIDHDTFSGVIHMRSADGRRVRMTLEKWSQKPLSPAQNVREIDQLEWYEPVIG